MKKFLQFILVLSLIAVFSSMAITTAFADNSTDVKPQAKVDAKSAYVIEANSGIKIYEQNAKDKHPIASMVKIMTSLLAFEEIEKGNLSLSEMIEISESASSMGGSQMFLETGDSYCVSDLLKGIVVVSANDASVAIAERIAGSQEEFVPMMNKRAKELGMHNTNFANCTGLPAPSNYSCAEDVAKMTMQLIKHKDYYNYSTIWMEDYKHPDGRTTGLVNTNKLIRFYKGCDGGKTGFTNEAKFCLSASAKRNGMRTIAVVIGAPSSKSRFASVSKLLNMAFAQYSNQLIVDKDKLEINSVDIPNGRTTDLKIGLRDSAYMLTKKGEKVNCETEYEIFDNLKAPMKKGTVVGKLYIAQNGKVVMEKDIITTEDIEKANYFDYIKKIVSKW